MNFVERTLYQAVGGFDVVLALCRRWHELCLANPEAAHPFERGVHPHHDVRLAAYLAEAFGGPSLYSAGYGDESSVQRLHAGNGVHIELDEACLLEFDRALADVGVTGDPAAKASAYFRRATEEQRKYSVSASQVPNALPFNLAQKSPSGSDGQGTGTQISYEQMIATAHRLKGKVLRTARGNEFTVGVFKDCPFFTPASTGHGRSDGRLAAQRFLALYNECRSKRPADYQAVTRNASYFVVLMAESELNP